MLYGQSHRKCFENIEKLFRRLSEVADLVIFQDGPVEHHKADKFMKRKNERYESGVSVMDKVNRSIPITKIVKELEWIGPSIGSGFEFFLILAAKYGRHVVCATKECDSEIAKFACNDSSVIAVIAEDSDFLIFPGKWRYFSTQHLNLERLTTKEYSRTALRSFLNLDDQQLAVFATFAGNDIVKVEEVTHCHGSKIGNSVHHKDPMKFMKIAEKVRMFEGWKPYGLISYLANFLLRDKSVESHQRIVESINQFDIVRIINRYM